MVDKIKATECITELDIKSIKNEIPNQQFRKLYIYNPIETILKKNNIVTKEELEKLKTSYLSLSLNDILDTYIVKIDKDSLYSAISKDLNIDYYNDEKKLDRIVDISLVDIEIIKNLDIIPLALKKEEDGNRLNIVLSNPFDYEVIDYLYSKINKTIKYSIAQLDIIKKIIKKHIYMNSIEQFETNINNNTLLTKDDLDNYQFEKDKEAPIVKIVESIMINAKKNRVSDIHIEPTEGNLLVRYRIDGLLKTFHTLPNFIHRELISRIKILSDLNVAERRLPQDGRFNMVDTSNKDAAKIDIRVSTFPTIYGEKVVMRLLEQDALKPSLKDLNLTNTQIEIFKNKIHSPYGLILITGPTGSGKTTTLYSALSTVDSKTLNVLTVEDPVEYRLDGIHQMQVNDKIGLTFASGLKTILRQDPDVIMVGEIRDIETANMAIRASLTGHIVFSTIHTNDSIGVIIRLINMGIDPFLVASSVTLALAQRLVRKICPKCVAYKEKDELIAELEQKGITQKKLQSLKISMDDLPNLFTYGRGCEYCGGLGYRGRQAVFEFFEPTNEIITEILKPNFDETKVRDIARERGMRTLAQNALELVIEGVTTLEELIRVVGEK